MSFQDLTRDQIETLNQTAKTSITAKIVQLTLNDVIEILGLRECLPDETPHFVHDQTRFIMDNSKTNRPIDIAAAKSLAQFWSDGRFVFNGEPCIVDADNQVASFQHRGVAYWLYCRKSGTDPGYPVVMVTGVPVEFGDTIDTGRSRSQKDIFSRNPELLAVDSIVDINGESFGDKAPAVRKTLTNELTTTCNFLRLRASGKNVQTGGQASRSVLHKAYKSFGEYGDNQLEQLVLSVYTHDLGQGDSPTWSKTLGRPVVAAALALWSMRDCDRWDSVSPHWVGEIDLQSANQFLAELSRSFASTDGELSPFLVELRKAKGQKIGDDGKIVKSGSRSELKREYVFGGLVNAIRHYLEGVEPKNGSYLPKASKTAKAYPAFGGVDCGYIAPQRGRKATEEVETDSEE